MVEMLLQFFEEAGGINIRIMPVRPVKKTDEPSSYAEMIQATKIVNLIKKFIYDSGDVLLCIDGCSEDKLELFEKLKKKIIEGEKE